MCGNISGPSIVELLGVVFIVLTMNSPRSFERPRKAITEIGDCDGVESRRTFWKSVCSDWKFGTSFRNIERWPRAGMLSVSVNLVDEPSSRNSSSLTFLVLAEPFQTA